MTEESPLNDKELMLRLYFEMLRIRMVEERIAELYPEQEMRCPIHLCIGQEAVSAGFCAALSKQDYVLGAHRSHGHYLAKGGDLKAMIAEFYGKEDGCCGGRGGSMHLLDLGAGFLGAVPIVGSTIPIAVGVAFGGVMRGEDRVVAVFFGDGATEEGVFHESLNFASLKNLPVVFVCENNLYSVYSPLSVRQPSKREIYRLAAAHGVECFQGDGNDVMEMYALAKRSIGKARSGGGPSFIELKTYRWREHCGPNYDNELGYRTKEEFALWRNKCPLEPLRNRLITEKIASMQDLEALAQNIRDEIQEAEAFAQKSSFPEKNSLLKHVYAP